MEPACVTRLGPTHAAVAPFETGGELSLALSADTEGEWSIVGFAENGGLVEHLDMTLGWLGAGESMTVTLPPVGRSFHDGAAARGFSTSLILTAIFRASDGSIDEIGLPRMARVWRNGSSGVRSQQQERTEAPHGFRGALTPAMARALARHPGARVRLSRLQAPGAEPDMPLELLSWRDEPYPRFDTPQPLPSTTPAE